MNQKKSFWLTLIGLMIGFGIMGWVLPFSGDDLMWSHAEGLRLFQSGFHNYNGRWVSNLIVIAGARYTWVRVGLYAFGSTGLIYLLAQLAATTKKVHPAQLMLVTGLLMTMSFEIFGQTFGWFSGYVNYVLGMLPLLYMLNWVQRHADQRLAWWQCGLLAALGVCAALIVEHITLYVVLLGMIGTIILFKNHLAGKWGMASFGLGSVLGALRMFSDPSYLAVFFGKNRYRQIPLADRLIDQLVNTYTTRMYRYVFHQNVLIIALLALGLTWLIWRSATDRRLLRILTSICLLGYSFLTVTSSRIINWGSQHSVDFFARILASSTLIFLVGVVLATVFFIRERALQQRMWLYIVSALILSAPFAIITPYGPRCALGTVCFLLVAAVDVFETGIGDRLSRPMVRNNAMLFGGMTLVVMIGMMAIDGYYNQQRHGQLVAQAKQGRTNLVLQALPFAQYNWNTSPTTSFGWGYPTMLHDAGLNPKKYKMTFVRFADWQVN